MKVVFPVFVKHSMTNPREGVWGEELIANRYRDILRREGIECDVEGVEHMEGRHWDVAIYSSYNLVHPMLLKNYADKNILWFQGFNYRDGAVLSLDDLYGACKPYYDLLITSARTQSQKYGIPFVIPAIDFDRYNLPSKSMGYDYFPVCDVSFIGNIIKPWDTNFQYLAPMEGFDYRLHGGDFGKLDHEEWQNMVWGSKVNLHYGFQEGIEWDMVTGSPLFLAASGAFCMSDKIPWFMETFKDAMAFTDGGDDEKHQLEYYLEAEDVRRKMAARAYDIVHGLDFESILPIVKGV